ncbi:multivesicular body subunit 12Bb isoform X2 [Pygocentrus nattereri]|uniref:multivesicular body subunit 12Bb isoform X2 n=1 Tax=Pygocentrus nattereri TaxID=42514 RepID=UPI001891134F|nr:multivesicular body subunit 12Bb isoform X2 [Pygocentrus nattereri]
MPDLQNPSKVMEEQQLEPITDIGMVSKKKAPAHYYVVAQTTDGFDADLWKDGIFKSKVTRYLCFTRASSAENTQLRNVLVDMKLTDLKDTLPEGFALIQETMDTHELALSKKRLYVKLIPRRSTDTAICDVLIQNRSKQSPANYTFIGELNGMAIWYLMGRIPQAHDAPHTTLSVHQTVPDSGDTPVSSNFPKRSTVRPDVEHQNVCSTSGTVHCGWLCASTRRQPPTTFPGTNLDAFRLLAIDDVPFMISERFAPKVRYTQPVNLMGITIKSPAEIEEEYAYSFNTEHSVAYH